MAITTRADKGSALTHGEMDENITDLRDIPTGKIFPKAKDLGIKIDTDAPDWGWHDLVGTLSIAAIGTPAALETYRGGIYAYRFDAEGKEAFIDFHMPHDYVTGTEIYIHAHWSHDSTLVTGGSVTWGFELMYAKGHNQAAFPAPITASVIDPVNTTQYQHQVGETICSSSGGSGTTINTDDLEVDGIIQCRVYLDSNDIVTSDLSPVHPFVHFVDIHYQSTGLPTKNRAPDFWT